MYGLNLIYHPSQLLQRKAFRAVVRTHLVYRGNNPRRLDERLQVLHVEVADPDAPSHQRQKLLIRKKVLRRKRTVLSESVVFDLFEFFPARWDIRQEAREVHQIQVQVLQSELMDDAR